MKTFEFSVIASGLDPEAADFADRFYDAGCDDATVSFLKGRIIVDFARDAQSIDEAISSAVACVEKAGAHVARLEPDPLVSLSDIAARTGLSRAAITHYAKGQRSAGFPAPVARVMAETSLYDWSQVAAWLYRQGKVTREQAIAAAAVKAANDAIGNAHRISRETLRRRLQAYEAGLQRAA